MIEVKSTGNWPINSIADINMARIALQNLGFIGAEGTLVGTPKRIKWLDSQIPDTVTTYRQFLLDNNLVAGIIEAESLKNKDGVFLVLYKTSFMGDLEIKSELIQGIKITGIIFKHPPLPKTLTNARLLKRLKEAPTRDVVREATLRMFQALQGDIETHSLKGKVNET